ncbi:hypothetical protein ACOQLP_32235, partial [Klebsiella pneumoniae]|uniref:hypothetical protein n=1 Tax=Klebsiella pneumoniae TaxID=573 RepID=UPI0030198A5C
MIIFSLLTNRLFFTPLSETYCSVFNRYLFDFVTSEMRTQPIFDKLSNHIGSVIGLGEAPRLI